MTSKDKRVADVKGERSSGRAGVWLGLFRFFSAENQRIYIA